MRGYKCQGLGYLKRDCPKIEARKADRKYTGFEWEITGTIQGQREVCVLDSGAEGGLCARLRGVGLCARLRGRGRFVC